MFIIRKFSKDKLIFFNVLTGQNHGLTEKKFLWPVIVSGLCLKIILSPVSTGSVHGSPDLPNNIVNNTKHHQSKHDW